MGRLTNKNILITGGNSGIGLAAAQEFDREGGRYSGKARLSSSLRQLSRARGGRPPRLSRAAKRRSSISLESSAPNSWTAGFASTP
jgi:NAD(P)-dependent dehydrogenase (short-subunit alcohol dehydrogenase family)